MTIICPDCGGPKYKTSKRCRICANKSPEKRASLSKALLASHANSDCWDNVSERLSDAHKQGRFDNAYTEEVRQKMSKIQKDIQNRPEVKKKKSVSMAAAWEKGEYLGSEEYCRNASKGQIAFYGSPTGEEWRQEASTRLTALFDSSEGDEIRNKISKAVKALRTPENKKRISEKVEKAWRDGAFNNRVIIPSHPTSIEKAVSSALDTFGIKHKCQFRLQETAKIYDEFVYPNILVEVNGSYWHSSKEMQERDLEKARLAYKYRYKFITIWDFQLEQYGAGYLVENWILPLNPLVGEDAILRTIQLF